MSVTISGQLTPSDVEHLAKTGVKTIINNRPDGEEIGQPTSDEIAQVCQQHGIEYRQIAFAGGMMDMNHVQEFADFYNQSRRPLHIFCRTGNRSTGIYQKALELDLLDD